MSCEDCEDCIRCPRCNSTMIQRGVDYFHCMSCHIDFGMVS